MADDGDERIQVPLVSNDGTTLTHLIYSLRAAETLDDCRDVENEMREFLLDVGGSDDATLPASFVLLFKFVQACCFEFQDELIWAGSAGETLPDRLLDYCHCLAARLMTARQVTATL